MPFLKISPDTVEPGGAFSVDASASKADGRLSYSLDLNGDGKPEWRDSLAAKATLKAPASGSVYGRPDGAQSHGPGRPDASGLARERQAQAGFEGEESQSEHDRLGGVQGQGHGCG